MQKTSGTDAAPAADRRLGAARVRTSLMSARTTPICPCGCLLQGRDGLCHCQRSAARPPGPGAGAPARRYGVGDRITFRLGNGLAAVAPEECDTIVIAGMGGENIAQILAGAPWTADGRHTLLLQPQSRAEALRRFLAEHGYAIAREALVRDRGFLYPVIEAGAGEMHLTLGRQWAGADLLYDPLGDRYIIEKIIQLQAAAAGSNRASAPEARERGDYARAVITELLQMREEWRHANCPGN